MNYIAQARKVLDIEIEGIRKVRDSLGPGFEGAVGHILSCMDRNGKVVVTGIGKNLHVAEKIAATFASTGTTSVVLNPSQAMHGDLGMISPRDVVLALSYSGESDELLSLVPAIRRLDVALIAITASAENALAQCSDAVILVSVDREACPFNMAPTASTTASLAVGDALAMVLLEARGFDRDDYAKLHPGGAIGRALLLRVKDIMRTGARIASVQQEVRVKEVLVEMTRARAGSIGVVDNEGRVIGIFTDGDLRRHIAERRDLLDLPIEEVMTRSPFTVRADQLAVDVLNAFEEHNFDDLLVVDEAGRLVGAIDIQDLPKMKIL